MNQEELQQKIAEYYSKLPKRSQEVFSSMKWLETLRNISERNSLNNEQIQTLGIETTLVLLSIISRDEYENILNEELRLPKDKFENILEEINSFVINPIITELSDTFSKNNNIIIEEKKEESLANKVEKENLVAEKLDPRFVNLPNKIKQIINESNYGAKIFVLSKENGLNLTQTTNLEEIVTDTIIGKTPPEMFELRAMSMSGLDKDKLKTLVNEINEKILKEIRRKVFELEKKEDDDQTKEDDKIEIIKAKDATPSIPVLPKKEENVDNLIEIEAPKEIVSPRQEILPVKKEEVKPSTSISFQKLNGSFKNDGAVTEYSLNNNSKTNSGSEEANKTSNIQKVEPYRMPIE